ncbi:hypothetical protein, partial [Vibrio crassostreae]
SLELSAVFFKFLKAEEVTISMKVGDAPAVNLIGWDPLCSDLNKSGEGARSRVLKEKAVSVEHQGQNLSFTVKGGVIP